MKYGLPFPVRSTSKEYIEATLQVSCFYSPSRERLLREEFGYSQMLMYLMYVHHVFDTEACRGL